jgi:hypothetical protein
VQSVLCGAASNPKLRSGWENSKGTYRKQSIPGWLIYREVPVEGLGRTLTAHQPNRIALYAPRDREGLADLIPATARVAAAMVLAHARTLAMQALCIPAGRCTYLTFTMKLHNIALLIPAHCKTDHSLEPSLRHLPSLVLGVPDWLSSLIVT